MTDSPCYTAHVGDSNDGYSDVLRHISVEYTGENTFKLHYWTLPKIIDGKDYATPVNAGHATLWSLDVNSGCIFSCFSHRVTLTVPLSML